MADKIIDLGGRVKIRLEENKYADNPKYIAHIYTGGNKAIASQPVNDEAQAVKWAKAYSNSTPYSNVKKGDRVSVKGAKNNSYENGRAKAETCLNQRMKDAGMRVGNGGYPEKMFEAPARVKAHRKFTPTDYSYFRGKGYTDAEILKKWDEEGGDALNWKKRAWDK